MPPVLLQGGDERGANATLYQCILQNGGVPLKEGKGI